MNDDPPWKSDPNLYFRTWEVGVGIIAACIPALRPGYKAVQKRVSNYYFSHKSASYSGGSKPRSASSRHPNKLVNDGYGDALVGRPHAKSADEVLEMTDLAQELTHPSAAAVTYHAVVRGAAHNSGIHDDAIMEAGLKDEEVEGIKKTMIFGTESNGSLGKYTEKGEHGRGFV